ncbi:hypothetical protein C7444_1221 [Sphaerotilus hippei]|uniref:Uncharacterized protein n=1 Tax=Sphaerotilus hippei TaxID=744406 RepID=A0A318GZ66_9BURK|nr:hypothetical protein C7444_1221 [Sphaerotilus hippei]
MQARGLLRVYVADTRAFIGGSSTFISPPSESAQANGTRDLSCLTEKPPDFVQRTVADGGGSVGDTALLPRPQCDKRLEHTQLSHAQFGADQPVGEGASLVLQLHARGLPIFRLRPEKTGGKCHQRARRANAGKSAGSVLCVAMAKFRNQLLNVSPAPSHRPCAKLHRRGIAPYFDALVPTGTAHREKRQHFRQLQQRRSGRVHRLHRTSLHPQRWPAMCPQSNQSALRRSGGSAADNRWRPTTRREV